MKSRHPLTIFVDREHSLPTSSKLSRHHLYRGDPTGKARCSRHSPHLGLLSTRSSLGRR